MNEEELQDEIEAELEEVPQPAEVPEPEFELDPPADFRLKEITDQVLRGEWGTGQERRRRLNEAGYDHVAVQKEIVRRMNYK